MDAQAFAAEVRAAIQTCRDNVDAFLALPADTPLHDVVTAFDRSGNESVYSNVASKTIAP